MASSEQVTQPTPPSLRTLLGSGECIRVTRSLSMPGSVLGTELSREREFTATQAFLGLWVQSGCDRAQKAMPV